MKKARRRMMARKKGRTTAMKEARRRIMARKERRRTTTKKAGRRMTARKKMRTTTSSSYWKRRDSLSTLNLQGGLTSRTTLTPPTSACR